MTDRDFRIFNWELGDMVSTPNGIGIITRLFPDYKEVDINGALCFCPDTDLVAIASYPAVTSHRICDKCGDEMRHHGYIYETDSTICLKEHK